MWDIANLMVARLRIRIRAHSVTRGVVGAFTSDLAGALMGLCFRTVDGATLRRVFAGSPLRFLELAQSYILQLVVNPTLLRFTLLYQRR